MKKYLIALLILCLSTAAFAQTGKKQATKEKIPGSSEIQKMMDEAMKDLSPEEKKMLADAIPIAKDMQEKGMKPNATSGTVPKIPKKQTALLAKLPILKSADQYGSFLLAIKNDCVKNIAPAIIKEVDEFFLKNKNNSETLVNAAPILMVQKKPSAALYASVKLATAQPDNILIQDNLAVILHQTGNAHKALPILQFLLPKNNHPIIQNNLGQAYLSLGDTANARKFFMACLAKDANSSEANCGMALILIEAGKINEAIPFVIKSLKNGYSETADEIVNKHKIKLKFSDVKQEVPEYFNPQKYKPIPAATTYEMVENTIALRADLKATEVFWSKKVYKENSENAEKMEKMTVQQAMNSVGGLLTNAPLARKALLMTTLVANEYMDFQTSEVLENSKYCQIDKTLLDKLEKKFASDTYMGKERSEFEICQERMELINAYLLATSKNHSAFVQKTLPKEYEFINQSIYWNRFIMGDEIYTTDFNSKIARFFEILNKYDEAQRIGPYLVSVVKDCKNVKEPIKATATVKDSITPMDCPIKIEIPLGVGKAKWDCKSFEIEGGELIMGGFEKDFQSGEMTIFLGLGAEFFGKGFGVGGIEAGGKIGSFVKFGKDLSVIDAGNKAEIGMEGGIGPFMTEAKLTGVMGMVSGVHVNQNFMGQETTIFQYGGD